MATDPLSADLLYRRIDPAGLGFRTTEELRDLDHVPGQSRAIDALRFGIRIRQDGYNLFALGPGGTGRHTLIRHFIEEQAKTETPPSDWCLVHNFQDPYEPLVLELPAGMGDHLRRDMEGLVDELRNVIPSVFEGEDYQNRVKVIDEEFKERQEQAFQALQERAQARGFTIIRTPAGLAVAPVKEGEVLSPEEFNRLPEEERRRIEQEMSALQTELQDTIMQIPRWAKERLERIQALNREVTLFAAGHAIGQLRERYRGIDKVASLLDAVQNDVVDNLRLFTAASGGGQEASDGPIPFAMFGGGGRDASQAMSRYSINLLVDNGSLKGAPVIYEDNPTHANLVGRIEHKQEFGALTTDFTLVKAGALHRANGGYLILDAMKVLSQPYAWEALKRELRSREIKIESLGQMLSLITTVSLKPEPIPLDVKVVLVGERLLYYLLSEYDPDFRDLFKVAVDFEDDMPREQETVGDYARLVATILRRNRLRPCDAPAVARVLEHASRIAQDSEKLSTRIESVGDLLREADYWATEAGREVIVADDVRTAIRASERRLSRIRERGQEMIERDIVLIDTAGAAVGQVNGLSVIQFGGFGFGRPARITASVRVGSGQVVDIEREVKLGGPIHSKGVLILSSFLGARFSSEVPLSLSASLVFEQSYAGIDGDSASSTELYALLSALSGVPVMQKFAVTGSVSQHGQVQAIGGVNEKIEGFFDLCRKRGFADGQGVLIPAANKPHLMLREDVVEAARAGQFHIHAVGTIDEGIEILTGMPAGVRDAEGNYPEGTINFLVEEQLRDLAEKRRAFAAREDGNGARPHRADEN